MNDAAWKAQRVSLNGQICWQDDGIFLVNSPQIYGGYSCGLAYSFPYLYAVFQSGRQGIWPPLILSVQKVDSTGHLLWRNNSTIICSYNNVSLLPQYVSIAPDIRGGAVAVWQVKEPVTLSFFNIWAKHVNANGSLGGPQSETDPNESGKTEMISFNELNYILPQSGLVKVDLFDLLGRRVAVLEDGYRKAGEHSLRFDQKGLPSGVYLLRLQAGDQMAVKKVVMIK